MTRNEVPTGQLSDAEKRKLLAKRLRNEVMEASTQALSQGQRALWFLNQVAPASSAFNIAFSARVVSALDVDALRRSFGALVARHETLRTTYPSTNGQPQRQVSTHPDLPFQVFDAAGWNDSRVHEALREAMGRPFDLANGPVFRVDLFQRSERDSFLVFAIHHIAMDGWSLWICLDELSRLYQQAVQGKEPRLAPVTTTFSDYVGTQRSAITSAEGRQQRDYWIDRLGGELPVLDLPTDEVRPSVQVHRGASHPFRLSRELTQRLKDHAAHAGGTLQMAALALYQILLRRYTGQDDLLIGSLASGRRRSELEEVVGYLANPVTLRTRIDARCSYRDLLALTRDTVLDAFDHQDYPFSSLVEELRPERDPSRSPIFQTLFVFEKPQILEAEGAGAFILGRAGSRMKLLELEFEALPYPAQQEGQFDLTLVLVEVEGELHAAFDYDSDLFTPETIRQMAGHYEQLAARAAESPDSPISSLTMLTDSEVESIDRWNDTASELPPDCVHALFERHAVAQPDADAAVFEGERVSYRELNERANRLARHLRDRGVARDVPVGIYVSRSLELPICMLATLKAGGAFLPLDPDYPVERLRFMLEDAGDPVVITHEATSASLPERDGETVHLERDAAAIAAGSAENLETQTAPRDLAYIIYTSGSTGLPKGTLLEHRGLLNVAIEQQRLFGVGPGSRVLQFASLSFDAAVFETVMALGSGGALHLGSRESLLPGPPLLDKIRSEGITIVTLPPSALLNVPPADLPQLETITVAGEACPAELVARWSKGRSFFNLYGPTEGTIWSTFERCEDDGRVPNLGKPIANTGIHVLDADLQPVPVGVPGELHLAGVGLARGYLDRPELTAERFIADARARDENSRLYRTGDRVRRRADGRIEYLGRIDSQVKVRGFRIELGEIEVVLGQHRGVNEVVVLARDDLPGGRGLVAYVVPTRERAVTAGELRDHLKQRLAGFMVPAFFVILDAFPLTPNGKVDRARLPAPDASRELAEQYVAPDTELQQRIAGIWQEALGVDRVGVQDNFFDLGGTSLLIAGVHARLTEALEQELPLVELFQYPTVAALASRLGHGPERDEPPVSSVARVDALAAGRARLQQRRRVQQAKETGS